MVQNLVSSILSVEDKTEVLTLIENIRGKLPFLAVLSPDDRKRLVKANNLYSSFITKALTTLQQNPGIMPGLFDKDEYLKDGALLEALLPVYAEVQKLHEALDDTMMALRSDLFVASLEVYDAVKANKDKVAGLDTVAEEMKSYFSYSKVKKVPV